MILKKQKYLGYDAAKLYSSFDKVTITKTYYHSQQELQKHEHEKHNLVIVLNGDFTENYLDLKYYFNRGDLIVHPKEQIHSNKFAHNTAVLNIEISDNWIKNYDLNNDIFKKYFTSKQGIITKSIFKFIKAIGEGNATQEFIIDDLLINIISGLCNENHSMTFSLKKPNWFYKVIDLLHNAGESEISLEKIAYETNVHPVYISRAFKIYSGVNLSEYYNIQRLKRAYKELAYSDKSVTEISMQCAFYDQAHCIKKIKSNIGLTPLQFRKFINS